MGCETWLVLEYTWFKFISGGNLVPRARDLQGKNRDCSGGSSKLGRVLDRLTFGAFAVFQMLLAKIGMGIFVNLYAFVKNSHVLLCLQPSWTRDDPEPSLVLAYCMFHLRWPAIVLTGHSRKGP